MVRTDLDGAAGVIDYYPVTNPVYSALRLYDGSGTLQARMRYTPYGRVTSVDSGGNSTVVAEGLAGMVNHDYPMLFTGQRRDIKTGLHYYKNRYMSPTHGFTTYPITPGMLCFAARS